VRRVALADRDGEAEFFPSVSPVNGGPSSPRVSDDAVAHGVIRAGMPSACPACSRRTAPMRDPARERLAGAARPGLRP